LGEQDTFIATDLPNMKWMLSAPTVRQFVVADNGTSFEMDVPDPRAFMLFKSWLSTQPEREPVKRGRDAAQAHAMHELLKERLPQYPLDWATLKAFPKQLVSNYSG
jgi:Nucleotidyltransferase